MDLKTARDHAKMMGIRTRHTKGSTVIYANGVKMTTTRFKRGVAAALRAAKAWKAARAKMGLQATARAAFKRASK